MAQCPDCAGGADVKVPAGLRRETVERMRRPQVAGREPVNGISDDVIDAGSCLLLVPGASRQLLVTLGLVEHSIDFPCHAHEILVGSSMSGDEARYLFSVA